MTESFWKKKLTQTEVFLAGNPHFVLRGKEKADSAWQFAVPTETGEKRDKIFS